MKVFNSKESESKNHRTHLQSENKDNFLTERIHLLTESIKNYEKYIY